MIQIFNRAFNLEFPFLSPLLLEKKKVYVSIWLQLESALSSQVEYSNGLKNKWEIVFQLSKLFLTQICFQFVLILFLFLSFCCLPATLSRRFYIINTLQNAVGRELQRVYVNSLWLVNRDEQKLLQWVCHKLCCLHSQCNQITYLC